MSNFIDFRKEYLEENPGSSMTIVRNAYYKSTGKTKPPRKTSKKKSRKTSRKSSKKRTSRKSSKKRQSRKKSRKTSKKNSRKTSKKRTKKNLIQTGGGKINQLYKTTSQIKENIDSKIDEAYNLENNTIRSDMIEIANLIQDLSLNVNSVNKISKTVNIDNYQPIITKLNQTLTKQLTEIKKTSTNLNKVSTQNNTKLQKINMDDEEEVSTIKNNIKESVQTSDNLNDLTQKMGRIIHFIETELK